VSDEAEAVVLTKHAEIREALYHPDLTRRHDERTFEEGNPRDGILSMLHGEEHRLRRRLENPLFRREALVNYERELFPTVLRDVLATVTSEEVDLFPLAGALAVVLAARRAGIDHGGSMDELLVLWDHILTIAQGSAILDIVGDPDAVQQQVCSVLREVDHDHVGPSRRRREELIARCPVDERPVGEPESLPDDLITRVLLHRAEGSPLVDGMDDGVLNREAALYLHGGSHTSAQTTCSTFHHLLGLDGSGVPHQVLDRVAEDPLWAQAAVHETLRLRPTTPRVQRRATRDAEVAGHRVAVGSAIVLDIRAANRDPDLFGDRPEEFDPGRALADGVPLWGLSFGAGPHVCIGRSVAGGFPLHSADLRDGVGPAHLYGLVALIVQAVARCGPRPVPGDSPALDRRTDRGSRWERFPLRLSRPPADLAGAEQRPTHLGGS